MTTMLKGTADETIREYLPLIALVVTLGGAAMVKRVFSHIQVVLYVTGVRQVIR